MNVSPFVRITAMRLERDGTASVTLTDGRSTTVALGREVFESTSVIASSTYLPQLSQLHLRTTRGHDIVVDLSRPTDLAPLRDRPTIYLDQNHWSTHQTLFTANVGSRVKWRTCMPSMPNNSSVRAHHDALGPHVE